MVNSPSHAIKHFNNRSTRVSDMETNITAAAQSFKLHAYDDDCNVTLMLSSEWDQMWSKDVVRWIGRSPLPPLQTATRF